MKRLLLIIPCIALSACSTVGSVPRSSLGYDAVPLSSVYAGGYSTYYSISARHRGSAIGPYSGYYPYYHGSGRSTAIDYLPHYYRIHGLGHSSSITLSPGHNPLYRSSFFGEHRNSLGRSIGHRRRH